MKKLGTGAVLALAMGLAGLMPGAAGAASIVIDDTRTDGTIVVSACDFENGAWVDGSLLGSCGKGYGGSVTVTEGGMPVVFSGGWIDGGASGEGTRTIYLVKAATPDVVSDILTYSWVSAGGGNTNFVADFRSSVGSEFGGLPPGTSPADVYVENGTAVRFELSLLDGRVQSGALPEPASMALVGLGLAGVAASRRRGN